MPTSQDDQLLLPSSLSVAKTLQKLLGNETKKNDDATLPKLAGLERSTEPFWRSAGMTSTTSIPMRIRTQRNPRSHRPGQKRRWNVREAARIAELLLNSNEKPQPQPKRSAAITAQMMTEMFKSKYAKAIDEQMQASTVLYEKLLQQEARETEKRNSSSIQGRGQVLPLNLRQTSAPSLTSIVSGTGSD